MNMFVNKCKVYHTAEKHVYCLRCLQNMQTSLQKWFPSKRRWLFLLGEDYNHQELFVYRMIIISDLGIKMHQQSVYVYNDDQLQEVCCINSIMCLVGGFSIRLPSRQSRSGFEQGQPAGAGRGISQSSQYRSLSSTMVSVSKCSQDRLLGIRLHCAVQS